MTGLILPTSAGSPLSQWVITDWGTPARTSKPAAGGVARVEFDQIDDGTQWLIDRAVASCTSGSVTSMRLYDTEPTAANLLSGTAAGNFDEADFPGGLLVRSLQTLVAVWTGCDTGAVATLRLQTRVMRKVS